MYWAIEFFQQAKKAKINPIIWVEVWYIDNISQLAHEKNIYNMCLIAKNYTWYTKLLQLITLANSSKKWDKPCIDISMLKQHAWDIYVMCWWEQSILAPIILEEQDQNILTTKRQTIQDAVWSDNVLLDLIIQDYTLSPNLKDINLAIIELANQTDTPLLIHNDFRYIYADDKESYEVALAIKDGAKMYEEARRKVVWFHHIMTEQEIREQSSKCWFSSHDIDIYIQNNLRIAESIAIEIPLYQALFPQYESPDTIKKLFAEHHDWLVMPTDKKS